MLAGPLKRCRRELPTSVSCHGYSSAVSHGHEASVSVHFRAKLHKRKQMSSLVFELFALIPVGILLQQNEVCLFVLGWIPSHRLIMFPTSD